MAGQGKYPFNSTWLKDSSLLWKKVDATDRDDAELVVINDWFFEAGNTAYADNLSAGAYTYTGQQVTDVKTSASTAYADNLSVGTYSYVGKTVTDTKAIADSLSKGTYTYTGVTLNDTKAVSDSLVKGTYAYTGIALNDSKKISDALQAGAYNYLGKDITDVKTGATAYADNLLTGAYNYTGYSLTDSYVGKTNDIIPVHGWIRDKKRKEILPPTSEEIEAERIRLGIVEAKKEIKQVVKLIKQVETKPTQSSLEAQKLAIHKKLLAEQIKRANDEYQALLDRINRNYLRARLETHKAIKRQQSEENDIAFIMSMLASI